MRKEKYRIRKTGKRLLAGLLSAVLIFGDAGIVTLAEETQEIQETEVVTETGTEVPEGNISEEENVVEETTPSVPEVSVPTEEPAAPEESVPGAEEPAAPEESVPETEEPAAPEESVPEAEEPVVQEESIPEENDVEMETVGIEEEADTEEEEKQDDVSLLAVDENFPNVVYVGTKHGADIESTALGKSPEYPYPTLEEAYASVTNGGTIKVVDSLDVSSWSSVEGKNVTIEGWTGEIAGVVYNNPTIFMGGDWVLKGDTIFQKLTIKQKTAGIKVVYPEGHRLQIGSGELENPNTRVEQGRVVPRKADTYIRNTGNSISNWFVIGTGPADGKNGGHITEVDVHVYGGGNEVAIKSDPKNGTDTTCSIVNTPNLNTIHIELIGSTDKNAQLSAGSWYTGMAPAFDGERLTDVNITVGYTAFMGTHSLFRSGTDKDYYLKARKVGAFPIQYTLDHITATRGEAVTFGEVFTTGDMTIDVWDSTFSGTTATFAPGVFAGQCNNLQINLHNSTLKGLGNQWNKSEVRNTQLRYNQFALVLDASAITEYTVFQDNVQITMKGNSSLGSLKYYPGTSEGASTTCTVINEGQGTISNIDKKAINIQNASGAELRLMGTTDKIRNVENKGTICLEQTQIWQGDYEGGTEEEPGKLILPTGTTLEIRETVSGTTVAFAEKKGGGSQIATIFAGQGNAECIKWDKSLGDEKTEDNGYWTINLGGDISAQEDCVYVRYGGSDKNDGSSYSKAVKSFCRAYELATEGDQNKKIVVCDTYSFADKCGKEHTEGEKPVVVTSHDGYTDFEALYGAKLVAPTGTEYNSGSITQAGDDKVMNLRHSYEFADIMITGSNQNAANEFMRIYANGCPTVMGKGINLIPKTTVFGGSQGGVVSGTKLTIRDGKYLNIFGGNYDGSINGNINLAVENASFKNVAVNEEQSMSIVGGNWRGSVEGDISVDVSAKDGQKVQDVKRIVGGNYYNYVKGNIKLDVSGNISFREQDVLQVYRAIIGGNFRNGNVTGNITTTATNITGSGTPYIIGGNGIGYTINGDISLSVDGVHAYQIVGGCGWAKNIQGGVPGNVTGDITMNIGMKSSVQADNIYGCSGDMGSNQTSLGNTEYKPKSMVMNLGQVSAGTVSGGLMGITVSGDTRKALSLNIRSNSQIRDLLEFAEINVDKDSTLIYDGITLVSDTLKNNGTIQYREGSVSVNSDYKAEENARIKLNSHTTVIHKKEVSGQTKVSSVAGNRALTIRAYTNQIVGTEADKAFVSEKPDMPLKYSVEENMSVWQQDSLGADTLDFVYVDGENGNDEWDGTKPEKAADSIVGEAGEEIISGPVQTLDRAYELIKNEGSIIVCGKTEITKWPNVQKKAFITSDADLVPKSGDNTDYREGNTNEKGGENTGLFFQPGGGKKYLVLEEDLRLRNLDFHYAYSDTNGGIDANGKTLIIGDKSDTGSEVTNVEPDVKFYKIQNNERVTPDTFLLIGGGMTRKTVEQIHLEIYNTEVKAVIGLWGSQVEADASIVEGNVELVIQDCRTSKGYYYCSDTVIDSANTHPNYYKGAYGIVRGDANVSIRTYDKNSVQADTPLAQLRGVGHVKNLRNGTLQYLNASPHRQHMKYAYGMFHAAEKCEITYESTGVYDIYFDYFFPVDENAGIDGGENPTIEINLLGKLSIGHSNISKGKQTTPLDVTLNIGNAIQGSDKINFRDNKQLVSVNQSSYDTRFRSYQINYYPGAYVKFDLGRNGNKYTTERDGLPVVTLHSLQSDVKKGTQTEHILKESNYVDDAVLECNNSRVLSSIGLTDQPDKQVDLRLVNEGSFTYDEDDFELNGSLSMEAGTEFITNGTVTIDKDLNLKENAVFPVENFLTVSGKIQSEENASLLVNNAAHATFGGATGETRVDFNGVTGSTSKEFFTLQATRGEEEESFAEKRFAAGLDKENKPIELKYDDAKDDYVTWNYGTVEVLDEIFLDATKGKDENTGNSPGQAVETFEDALMKAAKNTDKPIVQIVISGRYTFRKGVDDTCSADLITKLGDKKIVVTQKVESTGTTYNSKVYVENGFEIPCDLTFENIGLCFTGSTPEWYAGGNSLTIGEGVTVSADGTYPVIYGGHESVEVNGDTEVNVYSGTWFRVYGGGKDGTVTGNTQVTLGDALSQSAPHIIKEEEDNDFSTVTTRAVFGGGKNGGVSGTAKVIVNYGDKYGYIFGGSEFGKVGATEVTVDHKDVKIQRIYGGSYSGSVTGTARVNFESGNANRIYGGGIQEKSSVGSTEVNIGQKGRAVSSAMVKDYLRGSGDSGGVTGDAMLNIMDGAVIAANCKAAAGGYTGGVAKSILNISGGEILTDIYAGGAGEFKVVNGTILDEVDPTKGIVSASEVYVTGGVVRGSVYGGGNMGSVGKEGTKAEQALTTAEITNGIIEGDFYGGGSLASTYGDISMTLNMSETANVGGGIFGGGKGRIAEGSKAGIAADVKGTTKVTINSAHAKTGIYGGCNLNGNVKNTQVEVTAPADCRIYGGGLGAETNAESTNVYLKLGETFAAEEAAVPSVYGGGDQGLTGESHVVVKNWKGDVYGGGRGAAEEEGILTSVKNIFRTIGNAGAELFTGEKPFAMDGLKDANTKVTHVTISGTLVGNAYGGGELATVGTKPNGGDTADDTTETKAVTNVVIGNGAQVIGNIYGGGKGKEDRDFAMIYGDTSVEVQGGEVSGGTEENSAKGSVFGGGEIAPVAGRTNVTVSGGSVYSLFGGNDQSGEIDGGTNVVIKGGNVQNAFGGGFGEDAVCQNTSLTINGGHTKTAFAGGNAATVSENAVLTVEVPDMGNTAAAEVPNKTAATDVDTIFAGNNQAAMNIQPVIHLKSGKIGTFYGGGNQGDMTKAEGITYGKETFGSDKISIDTVYGGCNSADVTGGVTLELSAGHYQTVYGGNNVKGEANQSNVILNGAGLDVETVYGGGNQANIKNASVTAINGNMKTIYGGGNAATATESVKLAVGENSSEDAGSKAVGTAVIESVYCGNNQAVMDIAPTIDLQKGKLTNFYGGGNKGAMEPKEGQSLEYAFDSEEMYITTVYGGGHEADVKGTVSLLLGDTKITDVYGGCNEKGLVDESQVIVRGNGAHTVYGGGRGTETNVTTANVKVQNGTVEGNIYGGSGLGKVQTANVTVREEDNTDRIEIKGSVYGGGYGESSIVEDSNVTIDMKLAIADQKSDTGNVIVKEADAEAASEEEHSGETKTEITWNKDSEQEVSLIRGSVYGGGDMGKVGDGHINPSANTADIALEGSTQVKVLNGYIKGSVFGGGSGTPASELPYTAYMGTVFGSCQVEVNGGYVEGSIYGCGHQSRVYASAEKKAAVVNITETADSDEIIIGTSVFGGGNKGEGNTQNASVYTVVGDTEVNISGQKDKKTSTGIYFVSDSKGGVYGDGNLCLVNGERIVNLTDFNYGSGDKALLKTFYSLQRADEVNLTRSRIVLRGAKDLVDETANDTEYAINRVGQLNMKESSALKLTTVVNLLGGLSSDEHPDTTYIDRGNNGDNNYTKRGGELTSEVLDEDQKTEYRKAYLAFLGKDGGVASNTYNSFNVISVANGSYLELKKSDAEYGSVKGLFTLELLHANPGEGGGFVYADIGTTEERSGSTGDFVCTTPQSDQENETEYMDVRDTVGGYSGKGAEGDYTYYYWYIKGGKYTYKTNLNGYIGTTETEFETAVNLMTLEEDYHYILNSITGAAPVDETNSPNKFSKGRFVDHWKQEYANQDKYAIEVCVVPGGTNEDLKPKSIGYLSYGKDGMEDQAGQDRWGIKLTDGRTIIGTNNENEADKDELQKNDIYTVLTGTTGLSLQFVLHKGTGVTTEFKDVPVTLTFDVLKGNGDGYDLGNTDEKAHLTVDTFTSITRLVPTQAAYIGSGRLYAGVSSDIPVQITKNSAFTAQFITKFVPSAFNTDQQKIEEHLTTDCSELYLLDKESGIGFTAAEEENGNLELTYVTEGGLDKYTLHKDSDGTYRVTYRDEENQEQNHDLELVNDRTRRAGVELPKGTVITLVAQIDDYSPTYWYYYVTENRTDIALADFCKMGSDGTSENEKYSFERASGGKISPLSSNRVTENLTFVFDFSNVTEEMTNTYLNWDEKGMTGALRLRHRTTINSISNADIMDYVSTSSFANEDNANATTVHTREYPAVSNTFQVSKTETGLKTFEVKLKEERTYYTRDTYQMGIRIDEDDDFINTQYEEREYAVVLQQTKKDQKDTIIPFPAGTMFRYQGKEYAAGNQNLSVIIPVKKAGNHEIEIETTLEGFEAGEIQLKATLYSSSVASYYNDLETETERLMQFTVQEKPEAAVRIDAPDQQIFGEEDEISLMIQGKTSEEPIGTVGIYRYERESDSYKKIALTEVFANAADTCTVSEQAEEWKAQIREAALSGTYRLKIKCEDKTEYWDFVIQ